MMDKLLILTEVAEGAEEVVEETFNLAEWLNTNPGVLACILFGVGLVAAGIAYFVKKKRK